MIIEQTTDLAPLRKIARGFARATGDLETDGIWLVAKIDGQIAGFAGMSPEGEFLICLVRRAYRGRGIQRRLIEARLDEAAVRGLDRVSVRVETNNPISINNLISLGFRTFRPSRGGWIFLARRV